MAQNPTLDLATTPPCAFVCGGKDCRRNGDYAKLCRRLEEENVRIESLKCMGVCSGPVLATPIGGEVVILHKVRGRKRRERAVNAVIRATKDKLGSLLAAKSKRKKAVRRVEQRIRRLTAAGPAS